MKINVNLFFNTLPEFITEKYRAPSRYLRLKKNNKLRTLVVSLALQQVKEVSASATMQENNNMCDCTPQFYIFLTLSITIIGLVIFTILQVTRIKLCRG